MGTIVNAANVPLNIIPNGTVPDVSGALQDRFQPMVFEVVTKTTVGFQVVETATTVSFFGNIQPFTERQLLLRPQGERAWSWYWVQALPGLNLKTDSVINFQGTQYRIMAKRNQIQFGFVEYQMIEDYTTT